MNETSKTPLNMQDQPQPELPRTEYYLYECLTSVGDIRFGIHAVYLQVAIDVARVRCQNLGVAGFTVYCVSGVNVG